MIRQRQWNRCITAVGLVVFGILSTEAKPSVSRLHTPPRVQRTINGFLRVKNRPVVGAHVFLLGASSGQYGSRSVSLVAGGIANADAGWEFVRSDGQGFFTINQEQPCMAGTMLYLYATGGAIAPNTLNNDRIGLMTYLGRCGGDHLPPVPAIAVRLDEVTTVRTAFILGDYATDATHVTTSRRAVTTQTMK